MASGYEVAGADLDSILAPLHSGWPQAAAVGYAVAGADLNSRYAPLSTGGAPAATGYKKANADLNTIFAALGSTNVQVGTQPANVVGSAAAGRPSGVVTSGVASCAGAKGGGTYTYTWHTTGCSANSPTSQSTTFFATVNAASTDNASAFCTISDGVTSINTASISVTLQNTTSAGDNLSMVTGTAANAVGYAAGGFGGLTPNTLGDGSVVDEITVATVASPHPHQFIFVLNSYPGTITAAYLTSISLNGALFTPSDPNFTSFTGGLAGGSAQWTWSGAGVPAIGVTVPVVVVRT